MAPSHTDHSVEHVGDPSYSSQLTSALNASRNQAAFCDVTIIVGEQRFPAHRVVLSSASEYFQGMFSSGFQESIMSEVTIPGMAESFAQILEFMYTGYFTLSLRTVKGVLEMACYMILTEVLNLCTEYLKNSQDKLTLEDYLEIWSIVNDHTNISDIARMCQTHVVQNFLKCIQSQVCLNIFPSKLLMDILDDEAIETDAITEEMILEGTIAWMKRDWVQRKIHAVDLLKKIRLSLVPVDRLRQILAGELCSIPECKNMVEEVAKLSVTKDSAVPPLNESHPDLFATRNTVSGSISIDLFEMEICPLLCHTESGCYKVTKVADSQKRLPHVISDHKVHAYGIEISNTGHLYAALNFESDSDEAEAASAQHNFFRYDPEKSEWCVMPPMQKAHKTEQSTSTNMQVVDGYIYAISSNDCRFVIERYDIQRKKWEIVADQDQDVCEVHTKRANDNDIILFCDKWVEGPNRPGRGYADYGGGYPKHTAVLIKTATNELVDVTIDTDVSCESTPDLTSESKFVQYEDKWYFLVEGDRQESDKVYQCTCDFKNDKPSIVVGEQVGEELNSKVVEELEAVPYRFNEADCNYTFDKRKLGMVRMPCICHSHVEEQ